MDDEQWQPKCTFPEGLVRPVRIDPLGVTGPTEGQARRGRWIQTSRGLHVPAGTDRALVEQRILEQATRLGDAGAVTGWASLRLAGGGFFDGLAPDGKTELPVALAGRRHLRPVAGSAVSREALPSDEVEVRHGIRCTTVERALFDEMRRTGDLREAVVAMDMAAATELTSIRRMRAYVKRRSRARGSKLCLRALDLATEHSRSPAESRMRLVWILDARLPAPLCNRAVYGREGQLLGVPDLFDPVAGVVGEYDGAAHRGRERHRHDVVREDVFRRHRLEYFKIVAGDDDVIVVDRMLTTRARAAFLDPAERPWSLVRPGGEHRPPEPTLDDRLDVRDWVAERGLDDPAT